MATITTAGSEVEVLNLTLSATVKHPVSFARAVNSFIIQARTGVDIQFFPSVNNDNTATPATTFFTIKSGTALQMDVTGSEKRRTVGWLLSGSGTPVAEIVGIA